MPIISLAISLLFISKIYPHFIPIFEFIYFYPSLYLKVQASFIEYHSKITKCVFGTALLVGVYSEPHGTLLCLLLGHQGGITHLQFSPDGTKLLSGGRKDSEIICWDIRNPGSVLFTVKREVATNQRIYFDISPDSRYFVSGNIMLFFSYIYFK